MRLAAGPAGGAIALLRPSSRYKGDGREEMGRKGLGIGVGTDTLIAIRERGEGKGRGLDLDICPGASSS